MSLKIPILLCTLLAVFNAHSRSKSITIMLNPAGDTQRTGRLINETFERTIALSCCEYLQHILEKNHYMKVILTRSPGDVVQDLQNASFANRLQVDLYVSLHFYEKKQGKPTAHLYYFSLNVETESWQPSNSLSFVPHNKAYLENITLTKHIGKTVEKHLQKTYFQDFETTTLQGMPFAPLVGIKSPHLAIELSLQTNQDWHMYAQPLIECINKAVAVIKKQK